MLPVYGAQSLRRQGARSILKYVSQQRGYARGSRYDDAPPKPKGISPMIRQTGLFFATFVGAGTLYALLSKKPAEQAPAAADIKVERRRKKAGSAEENRDIISPQHLQLKKSWENPGVYAWGSNTGGVVAPESNEPAIKTPRRLTFLDGMVLRDLKLDRNFAVAVTDKGDLLQWGAEYSTDFPGPTTTLTGKNIAKVSLTKDCIIALAKNGSVYSMPVSREAQLAGPKSQDSAVPFFWSKSSISHTTIKFPDFRFGEKVTDISTGYDHCLLLTSAGRLFSAATSTPFPSKGQLGIPNLMNPAIPTAEISNHPPHEVEALKGIIVTKIAAGDYHSVCADDRGRIYTWGDNSSGQLGFEITPSRTHVDAPIQLPLEKFYANARPSVAEIAAADKATFFTVDAHALGPGVRTSADTWSCGLGIAGTLGNGRWTHIQGEPSKIPALSGLFEYDESSSTTVPIRVSCLSAGGNHMAAELSNLTHVNDASLRDPNATNVGKDVLFWGGNEVYQLGTGRRNNAPAPKYIAFLDSVLDRDAGKRGERRFQLAPRNRVSVNGHMVDLEQRVVCGRGITAVFSATPEQ